MSNRPLYIIIAGQNGCGKTTFYESNLWHMHGQPLDLPYYSLEKTLTEIQGSHGSSKDKAEANTLLQTRLQDAVAARRSLVLETKFSTHRALMDIQDAKAAGYRVILFYLGIDDPSIVQERIAYRRSLGGHGTDENNEKRIETSYRNLVSVLPYCDEVQAIDNATEFKTVAIWKNGSLAWWGASRSLGAWLPKAIALGSL